MELVQMSKEELERLSVMQKLESGLLNQRQAGEQLGLGTRQIKRLWARYKAIGAKGLISGHRGKPSNNKTAPERKERIMALVREHYADFGCVLAAEHLLVAHREKISDETLRNWMIGEGLWKAKCRRVKRHHSRERRSRMGELIQIDGSVHDWFEGRSPKCSLLAFIDDATSKVMVARFFETETTRGYLELIERYVGQYGRPLSLYSDRHGIFTKHDPEDPDPTQYGRALLQLDIEPIQARSPQAKGRVERLVQTLQDRMVKAMRLEKINTMEEANAWLTGYMQRHNAKFAVAPKSTEDAHRPNTRTAQDLARVCALHHSRVLNRAGNCQFHGDTLQVAERQASPDVLPKGKANVQIVEHTNGLLEMLYQGKPLEISIFGRWDHLKAQAQSDDKTVNAHVDQLASKTKTNAAQRLQAQIAHQEAQRKQGIYTPTHHNSNFPMFVYSQGRKVA